MYINLKQQALRVRKLESVKNAFFGGDKSEELIFPEDQCLGSR